MLIGYARVSTQEQETGMQIDALKRAGVENILEEKRSGGDRGRPLLEKALSALQPGDAFVVYKLDRVARSLSHLLEILDRIEKAGASFRSLTEVIDTKSPAGRMMMQIIGAFAEFERELIRERTKAGIKAAKDRGVKFGRNYGIPETEQPEMMHQWYSGHYTKSALAKQYGVHNSSVKRTIRRHEAEAQVQLKLETA